MCHSKRCAALITSAISRSEFMRHKTRAELCRATPHSAYPKNNFIRLVQKIIAKTFLKRVVRPPIRAFVHSFEGVWLASDSSTCSNGLLYSLSFPLDKRQGDLGLKENGQHRKRNRTGAITMEAAVEELTPLGVLKQPNEGWTYSRAGEVHSNLAGARDIERRAIPRADSDHMGA